MGVDFHPPDCDRSSSGLLLGSETKSSVSRGRIEEALDRDAGTEGEVWVEPVDVLEAIGFGWLQWFVAIYGAISYSQFVIHTMTPTLSQESLWVQWPHLATDRVAYNGVFTGQAIARIVAGLWLSPLLDVFGRKWLVFLGVLIPLIIAVIAMTSPNFAVYATLRSLIALTCMTAGSGASVYVVEMVHTKRRALMALAFQLVGTSYVMYATGVKWGLDDRIDVAEDKSWSIHAKNNLWRWFQLLSQLPSVVALLMGLFAFYETPRFLLTVKKNRAKAWQVFDKLSRNKPEVVNDRLGLNSAVRADRGLQDAFIGRDGDALRNSQRSHRRPPLTARREPQNLAIEDCRARVRFTGIDDRKSQDTNSTPETYLDGLKAVFNVKVTFRGWAELFTPKYWKLTLALSSIWFFTAFSHWGITSYCTLFFQYLGVNVNLVTMLSYAVQLPFHCLEFYVMQASWGGRIFAIKWTSLAGAIVSIILAACAKVDNQAWLSTLAILTLCSGSVLWGPVYSYSSERYPIHLRGAAMGLFSAINGLSTVVTTYVGSTGLTGAKLYVMPLVWGVIRLAVWISSLILDVEVRDFDLGDDVDGASPNGVSPNGVTTYRDKI
ncbi:major facilitator family transporter [Gregarina niphandrodes]|uniref:Major facilitator family transporter n=1 Tax=Gregarina niphandrodes TaxID=110365 RepID=A0A023BBK1_GRENI|nr:major facilitator family transporter [Gregarina niphandrodes]EZG79927.1 major facilitator family transporter [Gregarina niphandrodes]|eukprot:XP_011134372.1 major facilitator family transporter [Gregarina niphandrodes]